MLTSVSVDLFSAMDANREYEYMYICALEFKALRQVKTLEYVLYYTCVYI